MRLRPLLWALILVGGFYYVTSLSRWNIGQFVRKTAAGWSSPSTATTAGFSSDEANNVDIYKSAHLATVNITSVVWRENWFFQLYPEKGTGSGFIINPDGRILTNFHVISGGSQLTVTLANKKQYKAHLLGRDPRNDLALIKIDPRESLPVLRLGDSDPLQVGQKVLAIGNPFGLEGTLTTGVVSSLGRSIQDENGRALEGMIQTDAAINFGNSGGPLLDSHGNVIGINTAIYGSQGSIGIGFAMPINRAKAILDEFQKSGHVARPMLGVQTVLVQGDFAQALDLPAEGGLLVQRVEAGSAAEEAGIRGPRQVVIVGNVQLGVGGDLIVAVDGTPVTHDDDLQRAMNHKRAGDNMQLTINRGGKIQKINVKLGIAPESL
ncbi:MAG TPA: trypsin-like peptidase domain-containing protein [Bryobacteraceae bacterium]|nr:trypsin-like peptidase domain-containing protein [Bryobacteraceae bacterium]